ncbi:MULTISPECIES: flagellar protein FlaG [unclassified Helicobacter]|uniref:flagellar protein FlaG n=1 Tax=unclassified Helicobacter TaxID=2593540 RepID=UPI000A614521|nr:MULTISPECIES: flagellar protein FlaG [unclassified Helicobacter]
MAEVNTSQVSSIKNTLYSMVNNAGKAYSDSANATQASNIRAASVNANNAAQEAQAHNSADLVNISKEINKKMEHIGADINFSYNDDIAGLVVTVKDPKNGGRVIREIPSKEAIDLAKKMHEAVGLIFDKKG